MEDPRRPIKYAIKPLMLSNSLENFYKKNLKEHGKHDDRAMNHGDHTFIMSWPLPCFSHKHSMIMACWPYISNPPTPSQQKCCQKVDAKEFVDSLHIFENVSTFWAAEFPRLVVTYSQVRIWGTLKKYFFSKIIGPSIFPKNQNYAKHIRSSYGCLRPCDLLLLWWFSFSCFSRRICILLIED